MEDTLQSQTETVIVRNTAYRVLPSAEEIILDIIVFF